MVILIDDWLMEGDGETKGQMAENGGVKRGTMDGIKEMGLKVHYSYEIPLIGSTNLHTWGDTFWNGCGVFVCEKIT